MIEILSPENVLVYGAMPSNIFDEFKCEINFIHFLDWTRKRHEEVENGNR